MCVYYVSMQVLHLFVDICMLIGILYAESGDAYIVFGDAIWVAFALCKHINYECFFFVSGKFGSDTCDNCNDYMCVRSLEINGH